MCRAQSFYLLDSWRIFAAKSMRQFSSAQMAGTARRRIRLAAGKAFMPGAQLRTYTASETLFWMTQSHLKNIGLSQRRSVPQYLFGHSDQSEGKPTTISTSI